ncbi:YggS family pyridoxal phosphate-dependent enzyme [Kocuria sp. HSID16901]|uniref:YggS family pyridoxal phosphate-dependent enzyme n=1 Tax=Kocuria sp. HSID16901 TaxID=2419505 RepID=UPI0006605A35|nr:YggS family pyridoxal phosphate-dependent enzyme [Kocuria sp. HSID16901]RUQ20491.1 YggS family pyridoxal phosphate-dependent enzyme [Kocuria sp. HSID16901]
MTAIEYEAERARELSVRHERVLKEIEQMAAMTPADVRDPHVGVELITVTKFFPASDVKALYDLGIRTYGENRDQEASQKAHDLSPFIDEPVSWHYIGQLQSNKAKSVVRYATSVQSVDRASIVKALSKAYSAAISRAEAGEASEPAAASHGGLECFIQVGLDDAKVTPGAAAQGTRGGADPQDIEHLADLISEAEGLKLGGLMAVAPLGAEPDRAFEKLHTLSRRLRESHPDAWKISAGMSGDMAEAIRWGSTSVRVGSAIMGNRPRNNA